MRLFYFEASWVFFLTFFQTFGDLSFIPKSKDFVFKGFCKFFLTVCKCMDSDSSFVVPGDCGFLLNLEFAETSWCRESFSSGHIQFFLQRFLHFWCREYCFLRLYSFVLFWFLTSYTFRAKSTVSLGQINFFLNWILQFRCREYCFLVLKESSSLA